MRLLFIDNTNLTQFRIFNNMARPIAKLPEYIEKINKNELFEKYYGNNKNKI